MLDRLKRWWRNFVGVLILAAVAITVIGGFVGLWYLDHVRIVW